MAIILTDLRGTHAGRDVATQLGCVVYGLRVWYGPMFCQPTIRVCANVLYVTEGRAQKALASLYDLEREYVRAIVHEVQNPPVFKADPKRKSWKEYRMAIVDRRQRRQAAFAARITA